MESIIIPEPIRRIADDDDGRLAWYFFAFFSRFEYALKRDSRYLKTGTVDARPNWDKFASDNGHKFLSICTPQLNEAIKYFQTKPPRKQMRAGSSMSWSEPQGYDGKEPLLIWLLRAIRCARNNLFHGGKFPIATVEDPRRDRELLLKAMVILKVSLSLDREVERNFYEGLEE